MHRNNLFHRTGAEMNFRASVSKIFFFTTSASFGGNYLFVILGYLGSLWFLVQLFCDLKFCS